MRTVITIALLALCIGAGAQIQGGGRATSPDTTKTDASGHFATQHDIFVAQALVTSAASYAYLVTPGNRTRVNFIYNDTFNLKKDSILNGCNWTMIKGPGGDTIINIKSIRFMWKYKSPVYTIGAGDSIYFTVKYHAGSNYKVIHIQNSYLNQAYSTQAFIPVAIDAMDIGSPFKLVIPASVYSAGNGSGWIQITYSKQIRKNV